MSSQENLFTLGITGSDSGEFAATTRHLAVQKVLLELAQGAREASFLKSALKNTDVTLEQLVDLTLIRRSDDRYCLNFTLLTSDDMHKIYQVAQEQVASMVSALVREQPKIRPILQQISADGVGTQEAAFILLGCFSLDWDGLDVTEAGNYRASSPPRPNGDHYTPWAKQKGKESLKGIYWGSHNQHEPDVVFTTFGDHDALPRYALPDLLSQVTGTLYRSDKLAPSGLDIAHLTFYAWRHTLAQIGRVMFALRAGEKTASALEEVTGIPLEELAHLLSLLNHLNYIKSQESLFGVSIPVFVEDDKEGVDELRQIGRRIMRQWLADHYQPIRARLQAITPLRYGVPYPIVFTQIWHYIFGIVNNQLVEAGIFADPYDRARKYQGFIPAVWHPSIYDS